MIARNTAFTYKGKPIDAKQIGRELGVRYVLEGSVQRSGHQVRINVQLVDAETGLISGPSASTATSATCSPCKMRLRARIARLAGVGHSIDSRGRAVRPIIPTRSIICCADAPCLTRPISKENNDEAVRLFEYRLGARPEAVDAACLAGELR